MTSIQDILHDLGRAPGIKGTAVVTADGIMVASTLGLEFRDDVVAGLISFLVSTIRRALQEATMGAFTRFLMSATHGKVILTDIGEAFLVVVTDQFADLDLCTRDVQECALRLRKLVKIQI